MKNFTIKLALFAFLSSYAISILPTNGNASIKNCEEKLALQIQLFAAAKNNPSLEHVSDEHLTATFQACQAHPIAEQILSMLINQANPGNTCNKKKPHCDTRIVSHFRK